MSDSDCSDHEVIYDCEDILEDDGVPVLDEELLLDDEDDL